MTSPSASRRAVRAAGRTVVVIGLLLGLARCDWTPGPTERPALVVEAFLTTGEPPPAVTLRQTQDLSAPTDASDAATGGNVSLMLGGRFVTYRESGDVSASGRYVPVGEGPVATAGQKWALTARWQGDTARAQGRVPAPIEMTTVCVTVPDTPSRAVQVDSLRRDSLDIPADEGYIYPIDVTVRWNSLPDTLDEEAYWVRGQLRPDAAVFSSEVVEFFLEPVDVRREDRFPRNEDGRQWQGVYAVPVDSSTAPLPPHALTAGVVRGDTAFASFARSRTDPDRREPISNVDGGLGIAVAVSVDSLRRVVPDSLPGTEGAEETGCWKRPRAAGRPEMAPGPGGRMDRQGPRGPYARDRP